MVSEAHEIKKQHLQHDLVDLMKLPVKTWRLSNLIGFNRAVVRRRLDLNMTSTVC